MAGFPIPNGDWSPETRRRYDTAVAMIVVIAVAATALGFVSWMYVILARHVG